MDRRTLLTIFSLSVAGLSFPSTSFGFEDKQLRSLTFEIDKDAATQRGITLNPEELDNVLEEIKAILRHLEVEAQVVRTGTQFRVTFLESFTDEQLKEVKSTLTNPVVIEFAVLAHPARHKELIELAELTRIEGEPAVLQAGKTVGLWVPSATGKGGEPLFTGGEKLISRENSKKAGRLEYLVAVDSDPEFRLTSAYFQNVEKHISDFGPNVKFDLDAQGAALMQDLTTRCVQSLLESLPKEKQIDSSGDEPRAKEAILDENQQSVRSQLAIIINNEIHMAPHVHSVITSSGVISGRFTEQEVDKLVKALKRPNLSLPLTLLFQGQLLKE